MNKHFRKIHSDRVRERCWPSRCRRAGLRAGHRRSTSSSSPASAPRCSSRSETKRNADAIVDSVTAEDVGKFPNTNVAEAADHGAGRHRRPRSSARARRSASCGTDPALNRTLLNGQTVASADWFILDSPGRTFNYALLAPQIVGRVDVYKSPEARIDEGRSAARST